MGKYKDIIQGLYDEEMKDGCCPNPDKLGFTGQIIFDFTTYDGVLDAAFAKVMIDVIKSILDGKTFEYQNKGHQEYVNFILMCNMPFLQGKLEWGSSIRGAWFDNYGHHSEKEPREYEIGSSGLKIPKADIKLFLSDLVDWIGQSYGIAYSLTVNTQIDP